MAQLTIHPDYATDADWAEASRRAHALNPLRGKRRCTGVELAEAAETLGLSIPRAYELLRAYRKSGDTSALLPQHPGTKSGTTRLDPECEAIISRCIHESILTRTKVSLRRLLLDIEAACSAANVPRPSLGAVRARVKKLDRKVVTVAQHGQKAADDQFRPVRGQFDAEQALEKTQIDHTPVDMIIVDDVMRLPLGRPWISLSIDIASRDIPSFYVSLAHPSRTSVAMTMALMATDIGQIFALPEHMLASSCQGIPDLVHFDNAKEFHANSMQYGCAKHGIEMQYRRIATPHYGGHIERLIGTQMGEVHFLPGTTFSNVQERGDYDSEKHSAMTMTEFTQWFALQVIKYRNMIHSSLDRPPAAVWEELVRTRPTLIRQATDPYRYMIDFLPYKLRSIRRDGIGRMFWLHGRVNAATN
jgi:putative transposase